VINVGDTVNVEDDQDPAADPFVARVTQIFHDTKAGEKLVRCKWLFRTQDIPAESLSAYCSTHGDIANEVCLNE